MSGLIILGEAWVNLRMALLVLQVGHAVVVLLRQLVLVLVLVLLVLLWLLLLVVMLLRYALPRSVPLEATAIFGCNLPRFVEERNVVLVAESNARRGMCLDVDEVETQTSFADPV